MHRLATAVEYKFSIVLVFVVLFLFEFERKRNQFLSLIIIFDNKVLEKVFVGTYTIGFVVEGDGHEILKFFVVEGLTLTARYTHMQRERSNGGLPSLHK